MRSEKKGRVFSALIFCFLGASVFGASSISQFGITWTFNRDYTTGQYANGDYWVVGPVTITSISPASTNDGTGWIKNGSQLNPVISNTQGYDSSSVFTSLMPYDAAKNAARPGGGDLSAGNPLVITSGSLISSISKTNTTDPSNGVISRSQLRSAAILTVVSSAPSAGSFRPPPVGNDKTSYWNKSNLNYSILQSLTPPADMPALASVVTNFERPWLEQNGSWTARYVHPEDNQPDYGREISHMLAKGLLSLHLNYTDAQKETLYIRLVQYGIDVYGAALGGSVWADNGGHSLGRKMPMVLAGLALNSSNILAYANAANHFIFQEDMQTWYVTQYDVGRVLYTADGRQRDQYIQADVGIPEWGEKHTSQPDRDGRNWNAYYRDICYASGMGHALAAHLTPGAVAAWNWPAYSDYMDRAFGIEGANASNNANAIQPYVADMWNAYRTLLDPPAIMTSSPLSIGTVGTVYSQTITASGGQKPYAWEIVSGTLPSGLGWVAGSGMITGTPTTVTNAGFVIKITDNAGVTNSKTFSLTVALLTPLIITTANPLPEGRVKLVYSSQVAAAGGITPYAWTVASGKLPSGLGMAAGSGMITGMPTTVTTTNLVIRVTDNVGTTTNRSFSLTINPPPDYFTEDFISGTNSFDLAYKSLSFIPTGTSNYTTYLSSITNLPDSTGGTNVASVIGDDGFILINLTGGSRTYLYGAGYTNFYINSNGNITFGSGDWQGGQMLQTHFQKARIAGLWCDLDPGNSGTVTKTQLTDRVVVTFKNVPNYGEKNNNTFQFTQYFDGRIVLSWLYVDSTRNIVGLSKGTGLPGDFVESDLSTYLPNLDLNGNGILDSWETLYFGSLTNFNPSALAANGINTIYESYIIGLNPTNPSARFDVVVPQTASHRMLQWNAVSGRVYSVYWTTNLLAGFQPVETNIVWPQNNWTDAVHGAQGGGFYRIKVKLK